MTLLSIEEVKAKKLWLLKTMFRNFELVLEVKDIFPTKTMLLG